MNDEDWQRAQQRAVLRRDIGLAMMGVAEEDRRSVMLDMLLEFAPDVFEALETAARVRQERDHYREQALTIGAAARAGLAEPVADPGHAYAHYDALPTMCSRCGLTSADPNWLNPCSPPLLGK